MEQHLNAMRREAERALSNVAQPRMAIVSSYDPDQYAIKARLQPENTETGWMPLGSLAVGNGFGIFAPPAIGDQIFVSFQEGAGGSPVALAALYSDEDRPTVEGIGPCPANEVRIVHKSGARLRFLADGTIEIRRAEHVQVVLKPDGTVTINGPTVLVGADGANFLRLLDQRFHAWVVSHTHPQVGPPIAPPSLDASATTALKGA